MTDTIEIDQSDLLVILKLIEINNSKGLLPIEDLESIGSLYKKIKSFISESE